MSMVMKRTFLSVIRDLLIITAVFVYGAMLEGALCSCISGLKKGSAVAVIDLRNV